MEIQASVVEDHFYSNLEDMSWVIPSTKTVYRFQFEEYSRHHLNFIECHSFYAMYIRLKLKLGYLMLRV